MKNFASWRLIGDRTQDLEELLKTNLQKRFLRNNLSGNGVKVTYGLKTWVYPSPQTQVRLFADEVDIARPIYDQIARWINLMQKEDLIYHTVEDLTLDKDLLFEENKI